MIDEKLSSNFTRAEFACKGDDCCGHSAPVHPALVSGLQALRHAINKPVKINSGFRCAKHNAEVGSAEDSYHVKAMAADISVKDITGPQLLNYALNVPVFFNGGIGVYDNRLHVDVRKGGKARWYKKENDGVVI